MQSKQRDAAGIIAPPPALYIAGLALGLLLHQFHPLPIAAGANAIRQGIASILIAIGLTLSIAVMRWFSAANTPVTPRLATRQLVVTGPYRYSRNPDYVGQTLAYLGITIAADSWWPVILLPAVLLMIQFGVVRREEAYLEAKFGDAYRGYKKQVRRWL